MKILNLTKNPATIEQLKADIVDLDREDLMALKVWLEFKELPDDHEIIARAEKIANLTSKYLLEDALIEGPPWLITPLSHELYGRGINPLFQFVSKKNEIGFILAL